MKCLMTFSLSLCLLLGAGYSTVRAEWQSPEVAGMVLPGPEIPNPDQLDRAHGQVMLTQAGKEQAERVYHGDKSPRHHKRPSKDDFRKHREKIELFKLWRLMDKLELSDEQVDKFFLIMRKNQRAEEEIEAERRELVGSLREELDKENPDDGRLGKLVERIKENARRALSEKLAGMSEAADVLTTKQQARLILAMGELERDVMRSVFMLGAEPFMKPDFKFDRGKLREDMLMLRKNLESLKEELEARGVPGVEDMDLDFEWEDTTRGN